MIGTRSVPWIRRLAPTLAVLVLAAVPLLTNNLFIQNMLILTFLLAIGASGWNIMGGFAGYISLGNSVFIGLGAYTTAILANRFDVSPFLGCLVGGVVAGIVAAALSLVTRRTRGMYFVVVTFAALMLGEIVAQNWTAVTGGSGGLAMPLPTWSTQFQDWPFYYGFLAVLVATIGVVAVIRRSKLGIGLLAIQDDEDKATGIGIRTAVYKLIAFVLASTFTGIAGGLYAYYLSFLDPAAMFDIVTSVLMVLAALLGGRGTLWGPVLGAFIIEPLSELTTTNLGGVDAGPIRLLIFSGILIVIVLFLPRGVLPGITRRFGRAQKNEALRIARETSSSGSDNVKSIVAARSSSTAANGNALTVTGLSKSFGGLRAVSGVSLTVGAGRITGLIGPNGSGKTTLFNLVDGTVRSDSGLVELANQRIEGKSREARAHAGLARTYQLPRLFASLTVLENVVAPEKGFSLARLFSARVTMTERDRALSTLAHFGLAGFADISPADLSYGQRKLVELAQVLSLDPVLIMLDEPAAGISPALSLRLSTVVRELNNQGVAILLVEHDLAFVADLCDEVFVMANGTILAQGTVEQLSNDPLVVEAYLGEPGSLSSPKVAP
jgi:ABC-type branched-subunit amino acid transport system ATPase component/ABC-type branched-subunit amino acid transport system permease subunit